MRGPRLRVLVPVAVLLAFATPALRALPGGLYLPDPWLLLLLLGVPVHASERLGRPVFLVFLCGALRAAVSAVSPFVGWAGYGLALAVRRVAQRWLSEERVSTRFLLGIGIALPLAGLDAVAAARLGAALAPSVLLVRAAAVGLLWAVVLAPPALPGGSASEAHA